MEYSQTNQVLEMIKDLIIKVQAGNDLTIKESMDAIDCIISGIATNAQVGAFLMALSIKGESIDEITGFATVMRENAIFVNPKSDTAVDVCGTGGDGNGRVERRDRVRGNADRREGDRRRSGLHP